MNNFFYLIKKLLVKNLIKILLLNLIINIFISKTIFGYNPAENDTDFLTEFDNLSADDAILKSLTRQPNNDLLASVLETGQKLATPLWKITKPPKGRDLLYLLPHKLTALEYGGLLFNFLFNYTNRMAFSPDETLKLDENQGVLDEVTKLLTEQLQAKEASSLIPLFKKLTIQERKAGILIQAGFFTGPMTFQLNTSLQISERNFWLNKRDQNRIADMFQESGQGNFDKKELYKIKYGLGDTRLKIGLNTLNLSSLQMDVGCEAILPTSKISSIPRLKKYEINILQFSTTDLQDVLKSVRDNLITPNLGNGGHYGIGCYMESKIDMFHDTIHLWNRLSFDNLFPANEDRLIPSIQTYTAPAKDITDYNYILNELLLNDNQKPATDFVKQFLFPPAYTVKISPGGIFNFVAAINFDISKNWVYGLGYDYYLQQKEQFYQIYTTDISPTSLRVEDATSPQVSQHKIFTEINYLKKQRGWNLNLGVGGDYTISSQNMGHDWTLFFRIGATF